MLRSNFCLVLIALLIGLSAARQTNSVRELLNEDSQSPTPIVLWHGMGDSCCSPLSMGRVKKLLANNIPRVYVRSLMIGNNIFSDMEHGFFGNVNEHVDEACRVITSDEKLQNGYNAIGFSQGGQFLRAVAQRCPSPPMKTLISIGGQHQGIYGLPYCPSETIRCDAIRKLLIIGAYGVMQKAFVQAQYWHDPNHEDDYRSKSIFLADINNELAINETYRKNLMKLENFVLVKFLNDSMVVPKETEWFGFYDENNTSKVLSFEETKLYTQDRIGLKWLHENGKLHFLAIDGDHLRLPNQVFIDEIIKKFLR